MKNSKLYLALVASLLTVGAVWASTKFDIITETCTTLTTGSIQCGYDRTTFEVSVTDAGSHTFATNGTSCKGYENLDKCTYIIGGNCPTCHDYENVTNTGAFNQKGTN